MSSIDNRIVEMQFNNDRFEKNAKESMSTLDKLKEKLNFRDHTKELEEFQNASDSFNLNRMADAIDSISNKFSLLGQIGMQAMQRIASSAVDAGLKLVKSISVDQISAGMQKYEQETNVIQTLYGALKPKGTQLDEIYDVMETLTAYSDETSYSYTQMADAVSKFVNAGVDLKEAETVIEGISNAAAMAGIGIHDTEIIYRNFADAIGKGGFRSNDWKSIKIAHMDTEWLKEAFIQEAIAQGKLDESGRVQTKAEKRNKKGQVTQAAEYTNVRDDFEGTLIKGWLDNDVINGVMLKYATRDMEGFGKEAFAAAQNAKTFTDVFDAVKDSVSTGWSRSFRIIFGDLEEAIAFFTPMANRIIEFTSRIDEARNTLLQGWKDTGGRDSMIGALSNIWDTVEKFADAFEDSIFNVFLPGFDKYADSVDGEADTTKFWKREGMWLNIWTKNIENSTKAFNDWLDGQNSFDGSKRIDVFKSFASAIVSTIASIMDTLNTLKNLFKMLILPLFVPVLDALSSVLKPVLDDIFGLNQKYRESPFLAELMLSISKIIEPLTKRLTSFILKVGELYQRFKKFWKENKKLVKFRNSIKRLFNSILNFIPKAIDSLFAFGKSIIDTVKNSDEWKKITENYNKYIKPWVGRITTLATKFNTALAKFFETDTSDEKTMWGKIKKRFSAFKMLRPWLIGIWNNAKKDLPWLQKVEDWWNSSPMVSAIKEWAAKIAESIDVFLSADTSGETSIVGKIKKRFQAMWDYLGPWLTEKWEGLKTKYPILKTIEDTLKSFFGGGKDAKNSAKKSGKDGEKTVGFLQGLWDKISEFVGKIDFGKVALFGLAVGSLVGIYRKVKSLMGWAGIGDALTDTIESIGSTVNTWKKTLKKNNMLANVTAVLEVAASIWLLGDTLVKVSKLSWDEIARGLVAMAGLFVEEGAFMIVMSKFNKGPGKAKPMQMIGIAVSMWLLGKALKEVSSLSWDEIARGLVAMGGLFLEEGAFMIIVNRFGSTGFFEKKGTSLTSMIGLATSMKILGDTLKDLASMTWEEIARGLTAMGGLFLEEGAFLILVNSFGSPGVLKKRGASASSMTALANSIKTLGGVLKDLAAMTWEEIGKGLATMAGLFLEEGAFMILVNRLGSVGVTQKRGLTTGGILGTTASIMILAGKMKDLAAMSWEEIGKGLAAMAGIFVEEGAFMAIVGFLSKKQSINMDAVNATTGVLAAGVGMLADSVSKLGKLSWEEIGKGVVGLAAIEVLLGVFVALMSKVEKVKIGNGIAMAAMAGSLWILVQAFTPLTTVSWDQLKVGIVALIGVAVVLGVFCKVMSNVDMGIKSALGTIISAIALAALMVAFAFALTLIKDVDSQQIIAFAAAMLLVTGAMKILAGAMEIFSKISLGAAVKGALVMVIAAAALALAIALIIGITGQAVENFMSNLAMVGSYLSAYNDSIAKVDQESVKSSMALLKDIAEAFVFIGSKDYGNLEIFKTNLSRMGASIKLFGMNTATVDSEHMKTITSALKHMADDLSGFPEVSDVSTSIGNIGGAIKLYSDSLAGVNLDGAPDSTAIKTVFDTLKDAIPNDENLTEVASFASGDKGNDMTNFAIGLTNIATAVSSFSESSKTLDFTNMQSAISALDSIASLNSHLGGTTIEATGAFGLFGQTVTTQKDNLSTFAEDIVLLGTSLQAFGENISKVKTKDLTTGSNVLEKIADINTKLPAEGGISQWLSGSVSLTRFAGQLRLLGDGAKSFNDSIMGGEHAFNASKVKSAGDALKVVADINNKLPKTGGISSWFTGQQDLGNFGRNLKDLGSGVAQFADSLEGKTIDKNVTKAINVISRMADVQVKIGSVSAWYDLSTFGMGLDSMATYISSTVTTLKGIEWIDTTKFEAFTNAMVDAQVKLGDTRYSKSLKDVGNDVKEFFTAIWNFTQDRNIFGATTETDRIDRLTEAVTSTFGSINEFISSANSADDLIASGEKIITNLIAGMGSENSNTNIENKITTIVSSITAKVKGNEQNFKNAGTWIPAGFGKGIWENRYAAINEAVRVMEEAIKAAKETAGIASPSKVFAQIGMYSDRGLAKGFMQYTPVVTDAAEGMSQSAIDTVLGTIHDIQSLPLEDMELNPTIRPVLNTDDVANQAGAIDALISGSRGISFDTRDIEAQAQILSDATGVDLSVITQKVTELSNQFDQLRQAMMSIKMVVNTGALVGAMESDIDRVLGARARRSERGN